jgi:hypothetical protein
MLKVADEGEKRTETCKEFLTSGATELKARPLVTVRVLL